MFEHYWEIMWYSIRPDIYCFDSIDFTKEHILVFVPNQSCPEESYWEIRPKESLFTDPAFCEYVQDCVWDSLEWFDYNDALNQRLQENPLSTADRISYNNTVSWLTATNVQDAIDELSQQVGSLAYYEAWTDGWLAYTNELWVVNNIKLSHTVTVGHTANTPFTITHWLNSTRISVTAYDATTWEEVKIEVLNRTANTVDIISTTSDQLEIVIRK